MNKPQNYIPDVYEENSSLTAEISAVLLENSLYRSKVKKLKIMQKLAVSPLAQSHIAYYINKIKARRRALCARIITIPLICLYLLYILYRTYYLIYPQKPHYNLTPGWTATQQTVFICMFPVFVLVCYLIRSFLSEKRRS